MDAEAPAGDVCECCGERHDPVPDHEPTTNVQCIIVWAPGLQQGKAVNMTPAPGEQYKLCRNCLPRAIRFIYNCIRASPFVSHIFDTWTNATIIFEDPDEKGFKITAKRTPVEVV